MQRVIKPMLRHPAMPLLVVLQVALACAIAGNTLFFLQQKLAPVLALGGVSDPASLLVVTGLVPHGKPWSAARLRAVEADLRMLPGVASATYAASFPDTDRGLLLANFVGAGRKTRAKAVVYVGDNLVRTLGLRLVAGRNFSAQEESVTLGGGMGFHRAGPVIITRALARRLFPDGRALGRQIGYASFESAQRTVVGVVDHLMRNNIAASPGSDLDNSLLFPGVPGRWPYPVFAARARARDTAHLRKAVLNVIQRDLGADLFLGAAPVVQSFEQVRAGMLADSRAAAWLLSGITLVVLVVTLTGMAGMTGYWVRQRTRQIGVHRALGARRGDILRAFQLENLLVVGAGVLLGVVAAYGANIWLMHHYAFPRLPWRYLPISALMFLVAGQLAAWAPAARATRIAPVTATRTV